MKKINSFIRIFISILISISIFIYLFKKVSISELVNVFSGVQIQFIVIAFLLNGCIYIFPSLRLRVLLGNKDLKFRKFYSINILSAVSNYILPFRSGEIVKALLIANSAKDGSISKSTAVGIVLIERMLDILVIIFLLIIGLIINKTENIKFTYILPLIVLFLLGVFVIILGVFKRKVIIILINKIPDKKYLLRFKGILLKFLDAFNYISKKDRFIVAVIYTFLFWFSVQSVYFASYFAIGSCIDYKSSLLVMSVGTLGVSIPSGPGSVGVLQGAFVVGGILLSIPNEISLAAGLFYQIIEFVFLLFSGILFSFKKIKGLFHART